jgi:hypothetical protein
MKQQSKKKSFMHILVRVVASFIVSRNPEQKQNHERWKMLGLEFQSPSSADSMFTQM